jgi:hypothetical protein
MQGLDFIELTDVQNVPTAGNAATTFWQLPTEARIHLAWARVTLAAGTRLQDVCEYIELAIGSKFQRQLTPNEWHDLLTLDGAGYGLRNNEPGQDVYIPWQFTEPYRETGSAKVNYALDLVRGQNAFIRLKFRANVAANLPVIVRAGAIVEDLNEVRKVMIPDGNGKVRPAVNYDENGTPYLSKYYEIGTNPGGTKPDFDAQLDPITKGRLVSLTLYNPVTTGTVDRSILKVQGTEKWDRYKQDNDFELDYFGAVARAGRMDFITDLLDRQNDALPISKGALKLRLESAAGMTGGLTAVAKVWGAAD